jgi:hypothetical protein
MFSNLFISIKTLSSERKKRESSIIHWTKKVEQKILSFQIFRQMLEALYLFRMLSMTINVGKRGKSIATLSIQFHFGIFCWSLKYLVAFIDQRGRGIEAETLLFCLILSYCGRVRDEGFKKKIQLSFVRIYKLENRLKYLENFLSIFVIPSTNNFIQHNRKFYSILKLLFLTNIWYFYLLAHYFSIFISIHSEIVIHVETHIT